jgi:hypothetical protein
MANVHRDAEGPNGDEAGPEGTEGAVTRAFGRRGTIEVQNVQLPGLGSSIRRPAPFGTSEVT